ncbi:MAG: hypothetical protein M3Q10_04785, partial [Chloroflexota bacterium]|nr:hypothetical protein [Chloroflexota bacterium]
MTTQAPVERLRGLLDNVKRCGAGFTARCPGHEDRQNSLKVDAGEDGQALLRCHAGCDTDRIVAALGLTMADLFPPRQSRHKAGSIPADDAATGQRSPGCTLAGYAAAKQIPVETLRGFGLSDVSYGGAPAVRIPYRDAGGLDAAVRFRVGLAKSAAGDDRFRWKSSAKPCLYGRDRLALARELGYVALVEGESDCHTLWFHEEPAVGVPGASNWRDDRDAPELDGIPVVYLVVEPDGGGATLRQKIAASPILDRVRLVDLGDYEDPSALHLADPGRFDDRWAAARAAAVPLAEEIEAEEDAAAAAAWSACEPIARAPDIPALAARTLTLAGVAGEAPTLMLLFLILVSRFLPRPVSAAVKGPSSGGKSHLVERALELFPADAYYALSAMSERALAYDDEPLSHRFLVVYEAAGLGGDFASYLMRSLLSEGRVRYVTVEKTRDGLKPRTIERAGPTGLLVTTTAVQLHPENETRMLSLPVTDTPEQTRAIFRALAAGPAVPLDPAPWHALQRWLASAEHRVVVPFGEALAELVPPAAVRLRRDFGLLLTLIRANALLHQASRRRDGAGRIVATMGDYAAVRALVADLIAEGVEATVPCSVRETVDAVRRLVAPEAGGRLAGKVQEESDKTASVAEIAKALQIDKSAASRRVRVATGSGYLKNLEDRKGRPAKIALGDPLPEEAHILPPARDVADRCGAADDPEGTDACRPQPARAPRATGKGAWTPADAAAPRQRCGDTHDDRCSVDLGSAGIETPPPVPERANGHAPAPRILAMARRILALTPDELAAYRAELDAVPT